MSFTCKTLGHFSTLLFLAVFSTLQGLTQNTLPGDTLTTDSLQELEYVDPSLNAKVEFYRGKALWQFKAIDTTLHRFQQYHVARKTLFPQTYLTNTGAASNANFFEWKRTVGFDMGRNQFDIYQYTPDSVKYFRTNTPFTDLYYVLGSKSEQIFSALHTQNIGPQANITIDFSKIASEGFYTHDRKENNNIALSGWYATKNNLYHVQGAFVRNTIDNDENGGLVYTGDIFTTDSVFDFSVNRDLASTQWKNYTVQVTQNVFLAQKRQYAVNDSTTGTYHAPYLQITHTIGYRDFDFLFEDPSFDTSYYPEKFTIMDTLRDVSDIDGFYSRLSIGNPAIKMLTTDSSVIRPVRWNVFTELQQHELADASGNTLYNNLLLGLQIDALQGPLHFSTEALYDIEHATYDFQAKAHFSNDFLQPTLGFRFSMLQPTLMQMHYYGFNNRWDNDFSNIAMQMVYLHLHSEMLKASIKFNVYTFHDYVYFVQSTGGGALPVQTVDENTYVLQILAEKNVHLGHFSLDNRIGYQKNDSAIFSLPVFIGNHSWYYENTVFQKSLLLQTGIDIMYTSSAQLMQYDIVTGMFSIGGNETRKFYARTDVFINFDIRTLRFFLKLENTTQGLLGAGYYEADKYPMQSRGVKLGVRWYLYY